MADSCTSVSRYFVALDSEVKGPFDLDMIEAFILSGHYPQVVQICVEGSKEWVSHSPGVQNSPPPSSRQTGEMVGAPPNGGVPKWVFVVGGILIVTILMVFGGVRSTASSRTSGPPPPTYTPAGTPAGTPRPPVAYSTPASTATPKPVGTRYTPRNDSPPAPVTSEEVVYRNAKGQLYRLSNSDYLRLSKQKDVIDREDQEISAIQSKIEAYAENLGRERASLNRTSQVAIDAYNTKVDNLNRANAQLKPRLDAFNRSVNVFNAELERVGRPTR